MKTLILIVLVGLIAVTAPAETNQVRATVVPVSLPLQKETLRQWILPEVVFREADPQVVMDYLREQSKQFTPDKSPVNIVWLVPADVKLPRVTLQLKKIPFLDVIEYVTQSIGVRCRVEAHAVVIYKPSPPPPPPPPPAESNVQPH